MEACNVNKLQFYFILYFIYYGVVSVEWGKVISQ